MTRRRISETEAWRRVAVAFDTSRPPAGIAAAMAQFGHGIDAVDRICSINTEFVPYEVIDMDHRATIAALFAAMTQRERDELIEEGK